MNWPVSRGKERWRAVALFLLFFLVVPVSGCGKKGEQSPQGSPTAPEQPAGKAGGENSRDFLPVASSGGYTVFVVPASPSRITPPTVSVISPPKQGADLLLVRWFVNGNDQDSGPRLSSSRFQRGDRIRAEVKLRGGTEEILLTTTEVVAGNALPEVRDARIEPRAPISGSTVRAVVDARDPDGDPLTLKYHWFVDDSPVAGNGDSLTLTGVKKGSWVHVKVTPNDGFADGAWMDSPRYMVVNALPVVKSPAPASIPPSMLLRHTIVAVDPDGDQMTFTLTKAPSGMDLKGSTIEWQVPQSAIGTRVDVVVTISDGDGGQTVQSFAMTIQPPK
ncbi:MAG: hypothetical protein E4G97_00575 [Deltaproteobacteria bacterium]|nr:MAG: hypothetical protein E4G97_00575 [Deltaproteobacteria bacterium]